MRPPDCAGGSGGARHRPIGTPGLFRGAAAGMSGELTQSEGPRAVQYAVYVEVFM